MNRFKEEIDSQVNLALICYEKLRNTLAFFGCENREDKEIFLNNQLVLDQASMFIQYITNLSLGNKISNFITPPDLKIGEIRNNLSHVTNRINNEIIFELTHYYLNLEIVLAYMVNHQMAVFNYPKNELQEKFRVEDSLKFIENSMLSNRDDCIFLVSAFGCLNNINSYINAFNNKSNSIINPNSVIFDAVCYNLLSGCEYLKVNEKISKNELYAGREDLRKTRNRIAHQLESVTGEELAVAIKEFESLLNQKYKEALGFKNIDKNNKVIRSR